MEKSLRKSIRMSNKHQSYVWSISKPYENFSDALRRILDDHKSSQDTIETTAGPQDLHQSPNGSDEILGAILTHMEAMTIKMGDMESLLMQLRRDLSEVKKVTDDIYDERGDS